VNDDSDGRRRRSGEDRGSSTGLVDAVRPRARVLRLLAALALVLGVSGCATYVSRPPAPTVSDVVALAQAGAPPDDIIRRMQESRAVYNLSASQLADLRAQGVPSPVIDYMQATQIAYAQQLGYASGSAWGWPGWGPYWGPGWGYGSSVGLGFGYYGGSGWGYRPPGWGYRPPGYVVPPGRPPGLGAVAPFGGMPGAAAPPATPGMPGIGTMPGAAPRGPYGAPRGSAGIPRGANARGR
jgi:hypothetical protein